MVSLPLLTYRKSRAWCKRSLTYINVFFDMCSNLKVGSFARKSGFSAPVAGRGGVGGVGIIQSVKTGLAF